MYSSLHSFVGLPYQMLLRLPGKFWDFSRITLWIPWYSKVHLARVNPGSSQEGEWIMVVCLAVSRRVADGTCCGLFTGEAGWTCQPDAGQLAIYFKQSLLSYAGHLGFDFSKVWTSENSQQSRFYVRSGCQRFFQNIDFMPKISCGHFDDQNIHTLNVYEAWLTLWS